MSRLHLTFACEGDRLAATLDTAPLGTGLLYVSGGNEIRAGAFNGQAHLARRIAKQGFPVFRYDRRGIGDSEGVNRGFLESEADIRAALEAFRAIAPQTKRVIAFGNCDAASALMLAKGAGCDGLVLSNPWTIEDEDSDDTPPPEALRSRYLEKLKNPAEIARLLSGKVNLSKLGGGLIKAMRPAPPPSDLATRMREGLEGFHGEVSILLAKDDRTAQVFQSAWPDDDRIATCDGASHAYVEDHASAWLEARLLEALRS